MPKTSKFRGYDVEISRRCADYTPDDEEFFKAVDRFKREKQRQFPTLCELLGILKKLGWKKVGGG